MSHQQKNSTGIKEETFDVHFFDEKASNEKGFRESEKYCRDYIKFHNGSNESYFKDYKGGYVAVVCNETGRTVYTERVK